MSVLMKNDEMLAALVPSGYKAGDVITLQAEMDAMFGYVRNSTSIRIFLPLDKPIEDGTTVTIDIPTSFGIAAVNGARTLTGCSVTRLIVNSYGLYMTISFDSNSSLVDTTPIMVGINATITFS